MTVRLKTLPRHRFLKESEAPGRPARTLAGSWVDDLAALKKAVMLCDFCAHKWAPARVGYVKRRPVTHMPYVIGNCDGCKNKMVPCSMFLHGEHLPT